MLINRDGIWNSEEEIEKQLDKTQIKKDKIQQLKNQITIYKDKQVLQISPDDKNVLMLSQKGKQFDVEKPKANLLMLIEMRTLQNCSAYITKNVNDDPQSLVNSLIPHTWSEDVEMQNGKGGFCHMLMEFLMLLLLSKLIVS
jgi:hypothetical protein